MNLTDRKRISVKVLVSSVDQRNRAGVELESEILAQMHRRIVQNFLDAVILLALMKHPLSGYDVISFVHNKFHVWLSSATVYSYLYALERDGLIKGAYAQRKRVYALTERGKETVTALSNAKSKILEFVSNLFCSSISWEYH